MSIYWIREGWLWILFKASHEGEEKQKKQIRMVASCIE
jgi:hypothetical protein